MNIDVNAMRAVIDRDPAQQKRFGRQLVQYEADLIDICARISQRIDTAEAQLGQDITVEVIGEVRNLLGEIKKLLNGDMTNYGNAHIKSAEKLEEAQEKIRELFKLLNIPL